MAWTVDYEEGWIVEERDGAPPILVCDLNWFDGGKDETCRARLIAAAPELLAALKRLESMVRILPPDMDQPGSAMEQARTAIARAEGEP